MKKIKRLEKQINLAVEVLTEIAYPKRRYAGATSALEFINKIAKTALKEINKLSDDFKKFEIVAVRDTLCGPEMYRFYLHYCEEDQRHCCSRESKHLWELEPNDCNKLYYKYCRKLTDEERRRL